MQGKKYSDGELISALRSTSAIEEPVTFIYREFFGLLVDYVKKNNGTKEDAEDIFQETVVTFIELIRKDKFRGESGVKTFLYAVNRNIWLNEQKKRNRQERRQQKAMMEADQTSLAIEQFIFNREARKGIFSLIESLGEICKTILIAFYYENLSVADILKKVSYENEQVVRNRKAKCMKSLQEKVKANPLLADNLKIALHYE